MTHAMVIYGIIVAALMLFFLAVLQFVAALSRPERKQVQDRMRRFLEENNLPVVDITKKDPADASSWLNQTAGGISAFDGLKDLIRQAGLQTPVGAFLGFSVLLGLVGFMIGQTLLGGPVLGLCLAVPLAAAPYMVVNFRRNARIRRFEEQLAEVLDLVARALKAGQTFSSGLGMVTTEFQDPARGEFAQCLEEINFGVTVEQALSNICKRMPSQDLGFFVIAVTIQRQTGGNLAEIVENLSRLIRDRFKFKGKVKALSAEGRMSAWVLLALPFFMTGLLRVLNPEFMAVLFQPQGLPLVYGALGSMTFGAIWLKRMVNIKV